MPKNPVNACVEDDKRRLTAVLPNTSKKMANDKISMPSGMGGLVRYFDDYKSKIELKPGHVIVLAVMVIIIMLILHAFY